MGPEERIIDDDDRLFPTSLGNWSGDATWWNMSQWAPYNAALFNLDVDHPTAQETLAYPAIQIEPDGANDFQVYVINLVAPELQKCTIRATDGNYTYEIINTVPPPPNEPYILAFSTMHDWNKTNARIEIIVEAIPPGESSIYFFYPSVIEQWWPPAHPKIIQYLPIVGMG